VIVVFSYLAWVAGRNVTDTGLLIALAATLPRQIDLSYSLHGLASGWNDLLAVWTRIGGACAAMRPLPDSGFESRIRFDGVALQDERGLLVCSSMEDVLALVAARRFGRLQVRGSNGSGKSTLLVALKARLGVDAFYWPTGDRLAFAFAGLPGASEAGGEGAKSAESGDTAAPGPGAAAPLPGQRAAAYAGFSSGERQLASLREIASHTAAQVYLLDEWDANLDANNRASAEQLVAGLSKRAVVVEISHRDRV